MFYKYNKPKGDFANQSVRRLSKQLNTRKIGHTGILDPLASGLMLVASDFETKMLQYIPNKNKIYIANCDFGFMSDTYDVTGEIQNTNDATVQFEQLKDASNKMLDCTEQIPPIYSAKKINGKKAYEYARENKQVEMRVQKIKINKCDLLNFNSLKQTAEFLMDVSEGTYIRTVLVDIAKLCNTHAIMTDLKRVKVGNIELGNLESGQIEQINYEDLFDNQIIPLEEKMVSSLSNGAKVKVNANDGLCFIKNPHLNLVCAIGQVENGYFKPSKISHERLVWKK
ncbi:tRNA pseudouridine(55) synthase TruB [Mycoplasma sp. Pen4]|uniref:tRNA pseudouridine(55) synthase TruB n=1 Tax=Mycoplasma sp. Pen4 TaxID=640330 RepID=UPI0016543482|nr:tRNA pseudouridine(55) synthase TruB [Mycoplasma sp. Pen4]QNM93402.1 tRNA pseudouridine(55) synthase TruB [Mycoplasma sp. Pen4]